MFVTCTETEVDGASFMLWEQALGCQLEKCSLRGISFLSNQFPSGFYISPLHAASGYHTDISEQMLP